MTDELVKTRIHIVKCAESDYQKLTYKNPLCIYITNETGDFSDQSPETTGNIYVGAYQIASNVIIPGTTGVMKNVISKYIVQSTANNTDIQSGDAMLLNIKGTLDDRMAPFIADTYVATSMNLVNPEQYITIDGHKAFYFFVDKGVWGTPGTTNQNNGYIIVNGNVAGVYFKSTKPTAASYGTACPFTTYEQRNHYTPDNIGWLTIVTNDDNAPACHLTWSGRHDDEAGVFDNYSKSILSAIQAVHSWGLSGLIGSYNSSYDELDLVAQKGYARNDRTILADLSWTQSIVPDQERNTYVYTAQISAMKSDGLWRTTYQVEGVTLSVSGNTITISSDSISTTAALLESLGANLFYYEKATPSVVDISLTTAIKVNDMGLTAFLYGGELASVAAIVEESFYLGVSDQILNAVAEISNISRIVAEALCGLYGSVNSINIDNAGNLRCKSIDSDELPYCCGYPSKIIQALPAGTAPTVTPDFIGQEFYDTYNNIIYGAIGVASAADWIVKARKN